MISCLSNMTSSVINRQQQHNKRQNKPTQQVEVEGAMWECSHILSIILILFRCIYASCHTFINTVCVQELSLKGFLFESSTKANQNADNGI